jgi:phosphoglycolate phosphatase
MLVIFDLDGTLIDSRIDLANSTNEVLVGYGARPRPVDRIAAMVGEGARTLVQRALADAAVDAPIDDALERFHVAYDRRLLEHTAPYSGIPDVVRAAANLGRVALLTNKPEAPARRLLEAFDLLAPFMAVIGGDSGFPRKPDPTAVQHLITTARAAPAETLFVGDSEIDVQTARRAAVSICVARYGFGYLRGDLNVGAGDFVAETPADVGRIIEAFAS